MDVKAKFKYYADLRHAHTIIAEKSKNFSERISSRHQVEKYQKKMDELVKQKGVIL